MTPGGPAIYGDPRLYDLLAAWMAPADDAFWSWVAARYGGPVLEIGVGTGRVALALAALGVEVAGLDRSPVFLATARQRAADRGLSVDLHEGDMRDFDLGRPFATVIVPYHTVHHLLDIGSFRSFCAAVRRHLGSDGRLVFDAFQPDLKFLVDHPEEKRCVLEGDDPDRGHLRLFEENHYDRATQVNRILWSWEVAGRADAERDELRMRILFPQELDALVALGGFLITDKWGDYDRSPFDSESPQQIVVARPA